MMYWTMKSVPLLLYTLMLPFATTAVDDTAASPVKERNMQVMLCRCEKRKEDLYDRRHRTLRGGETGDRMLGGVQDENGYWILDGFRVLPNKDEDCAGGKKRKKGNIFDNKNRKLSFKDGEDYGETVQDEYKYESEEDAGMGEIEGDKQEEMVMRRRLRAERSFLCRANLLVVPSVASAFIASVAIGIVDSTTGNVASQQDVADFVEDIAAGIIDSTLGNNLVTNGEIGQLVEDIADSVEKASGGNVGTIITNEELQDVVEDIADSIEAATGIEIDNNLVEDATLGPPPPTIITAETFTNPGNGFSPYAVFVDTSNTNFNTNNFNQQGYTPPFFPGADTTNTNFNTNNFNSQAYTGPTVGQAASEAIASFTSTGGAGGANGYAQGFFDIINGLSGTSLDSSTSP